MLADYLYRKRCYQLQLSRYIHSNLLEATAVTNLKKSWSRKREKYKAYVDEGVDEDIYSDV